MAYYDQTFSYGGHSFSIRVDMHTNLRDDGNGRSTWLNTIAVTNYDGTTAGKDVPDKEVQRAMKQYADNNRSLIDGIVDSELDTALINDGYTRH